MCRSVAGEGVGNHPCWGGEGKENEREGIAEAKEKVWKEVCRQMRYRYSYHSLSKENDENQMIILTLDSGS